MNTGEKEDELICPGCEAPESLWMSVEGSGFIGKSGEIYCCEACAKGQICDCNPEHLEALVKKLGT